MEDLSLMDFNDVFVGLYGVYDRRAEQYTGIFVSENDATAVRAFKQSAESAPKDFLDDYELHKMADYCQGTGRISQQWTPANKPDIKFVVSLASLLHA